MRIFRSAKGTYVQRIFREQILCFNESPNFGYVWSTEGPCSKVGHQIMSIIFFILFSLSYIQTDDRLLHSEYLKNLELAKEGESLFHHEATA